METEPEFGDISGTIIFKENTITIKGESDTSIEFNAEFMEELKRRSDLLAKLESKVKYGNLKSRPHLYLSYTSSILTRSKY